MQRITLMQIYLKRARSVKTILLLLALQILIPFAARCEESAMAENSDIYDKRYECVRDTNTPVNVSYLSTRFKTAEQWKKRVAELREQILASAGLLPMPEKTPLNAHIFGRIDHEDYTIEKVYFESYPGFYVTGNLYRPKGNGPFPAVLNPHGHWEHGRLENSDKCSVPGRCINFAKQGYIAFTYDMVGRNDSKQVTHTPDTLGERRNRLWGISLGGLQLWNSIRAVDFLESLPDVDKERIACTGASGGGTQTFLLCAVDDRVKVAAPVNMISHTMQGGCRCENLPGLRIDTNNVEIGAMMAPRPLLMVSATGDWTKDTPNVEFPAIQSIYKLFGAEDKVECVRIDASHNYNKESREEVYSFFSKWLSNKPLPQPVLEQSFEVEKDEDLLVFPDGKLPNCALTQDELVKQFIEASEKQLEAYRPDDEFKLGRFRQVYGLALRRVLAIPSSIIVDESDSKVITSNADHKVQTITLLDKERGASILTTLYEPSTPNESRTLLVINSNAKCKLPNNLRRWRILSIDCQARAKRDFDVGFFDTYNRTDAAERVYEILVAVEYLSKKLNIMKISLFGNGEAGLWCLLAMACASNVDSAVVDVCGLDTSSDNAMLSDSYYIPCFRRVGDFRTAIALIAPRKLFIHNAQGRFDTSWSELAYKVAGKPSALRIEYEPASEADIVRWFDE